MRIIYLVAAHNEVHSLRHLVDHLASLSRRMPTMQAYVIDNGSDDGTGELLMNLDKQHLWLHGISIPEKGMGLAFRHGMRVLRKLDLSSDDWILFTAADLPFGFSDIEAFTKFETLHPESSLFIGSKAHRQSKIDRSWKRSLASWAYGAIRGLLLNMKTADPQGTLFLRANYLNLVDRIISPDYFFTTELVYFMEKQTRVVEMPVNLSPERRASKVHLVRDGIKALKQIRQLRGRTSATARRSS
jgi:dolichyl-phosphate beta-glucosyltransferase